MISMGQQYLGVDAAMLAEDAFAVQGPGVLKQGKELVSACSMSTQRVLADGTAEPL